MRTISGILIFISVLLTQTALAGEADDLAQQGYDEINAGNYEAAIEMFLAAVEKEKDHAGANTGLLKLYLLVGDYEQAVQNVLPLSARKKATA